MVFIGGNKRQVKNELLEIICLSLEKFLTSIPFHKVGKNIKDFLLWFASPKTFPKIPKTIPWPWPQLVAIYTHAGRLTYERRRVKSTYESGTRDISLYILFFFQKCHDK